MKRRRKIKQTQTLEDRLAERAKDFREEAELLPLGAAKEKALRKARLAEQGAHMSEWLSLSAKSPKA